MPTEVPIDRIPREVFEVCDVLRQRGHRAWIVGGCVRDLLRGLEVADWDLCTSAKPEQTKACFKKVIPTGIAHGTVTVLWKGHAFEVTTLRGEGAYTDGRRPDEVFFVDDIREDLARRDFTVNAIAYDPVLARVEDPFEGRVDLDAGILRAVGVPAERFAEDGLRILRGARFVATLEMELHPATRDAFAGALDVYAKVSHERIREEWLKAFKARRPSRAFAVMQQTGILARTCDPLDALTEVAIGPGRNAFDHALAAMDLAKGPVPRLAALLHGVGRGRAADGHAGEVAADLIEPWLRDYRFSNDERRDVLHLVRHHDLGAPRTWDDVELRRFLQRVDASKAEAVLATARVVRLAADEDVAWIDELTERVRTVLASPPPLRIGDLAVDGKDVLSALGGQGGRAVGRILESLLEHVIVHPEDNTRASLEPRLKALAAEVSA
ncbi:MAG: hypothetical protein KC586_29475 [Myxococcales bacterium]|nr:hypothetical protein [Myxococcales bacterium]